MGIFSQFLKLGLGFERLLFVVLLSLIGIHIVTCLWILFPTIMHDSEEDDEIDTDLEGTWLHNYKLKNISDTQLYITSLYWTITTITTVGYGDIYGHTSFEKIFCILIMITGVVGFSFVTGSVTSIISNLDQSNAI